MNTDHRERRTIERRVEERRESHFEFERLISELSTRFINLRPDEVDREIEDALRRFCKPLGIELAVLWQWSALDPTILAPTHTYCNQAIHPAFEPLHQALFPWFYEQMLAGSIVAISSIEDLPPQAAIDMENCRLWGIRSNLTLPLSLGGEPPVGVLGLNTLQDQREWPNGLVKQLQLVAQVFTNAIARMRHEQARQVSEARLSAGSRLAGLAFYEVDFRQGTVYADNHFRELCGVPPEREMGVGMLQFWMKQLHPDDRERVLSKRRELHDGTIEQASIKYRFLHPTQGEKWIEHEACVSKRDAAGHTLQSYGVLRDVTGQKRIEHEMRDLSRRLIRAQEDERALLARELHDDVTQRLAVLAIEIGRAELVAGDVAQAAAMRSAREELMAISEEIHSLAYQLHPSILRELGLVEALRAECGRRVRQGRIELSVDIDPSPADVGADAALCLFRVAQEALNNVVHHARARTASLTLRQMDGGLMLAVSDDGVGFDPAQSPERMHLGLASMRERVQLACGTFDIESVPCQGTTILAWVPAQGGRP